MESDETLVRIFFAKMKSAYLTLSEQEKLEFMKKDRANLDQLGMKALSMIDCSKFNEEWDYIGVEGWPSREAIQNRETFENDELQLAKYVDYRTILGTEMPFDSYGN